MDSVLIVSIVILLLSGPIIVKGQGPVYLFSKNVTLSCFSTTPSEGEQFSWIDQTEAVTIYSVNGPGDKEKTFDGRNNDKYYNFDIDNNYPDDVNLLIKSLEVNDAGIYICNFLNQAAPDPLIVNVEAMPISVSISCAKSSSTNCPSPSSPTLDPFSCNCIAIGAYPNSLQFEWSGGATGVQQSYSSSTERTGTFDYDTDAKIVPTENPGSVTCTLNGYNKTWEGVRNAVYNFNPPMCELQSTCIKTGTMVSLTCTCTDASPAEGLVYSFYRDGLLLSSGDTNVVEADIEVDQEYIFECRGCNGLNYGSASNDSELVVCQRSTTALPTTTITTVPLSTNEPTSTKATESSTEESMTTCSNTTGSGLGPGAIAGICCATSAVVIVIVVIAVMMLKNGKCGSKFESSSLTDGSSTGQLSYFSGNEQQTEVNEVKTDAKKSSNNDNRNENNGKEALIPVYAEVKTKSDKQDYNGKGPGKYPEIPPHGVINKKMAKGPTPAPRSSMRDSKNSPKPEQQTGNESADTAHGKESPQDETENQSVDTDHGKESPENEMETQYVNIIYG